MISQDERSVRSGGQGHSRRNGRPGLPGLLRPTPHVDQILRAPLDRPPLPSSITGLASESLEQDSALGQLRLVFCPNRFLALFDPPIKILGLKLLGAGHLEAKKLTVLGESDNRLVHDAQIGPGTSLRVIALEVMLDTLESSTNGGSRLGEGQSEVNLLRLHGPPRLWPAFGER